MLEEQAAARRKRGWLIIGFALGALLIWGAAAHDPQGLWGQTTAAWIQAVGSLVAIGLTWWQARRDQRERKVKEAADARRERAEQRALLESARLLVQEAATAVDLTYIAVVTADPNKLASARGSLDSAADAIRSFPSHSLRFERAVSMLSVARSTLSTARHQVSGGLPAAVNASSSFAADVLKTSADTLHRAHEEVIKLSLDEANQPA